MAKIWGVPHNSRAKKFKNFIRIQGTKGGGMSAATWPRKGQYDKSPAGLERSNIFGQVQSWSTRPLPFAQLDALTMAVGTPYLPRDILTKNAYGKLTEIHMKDGRIIFPFKPMSQEAQAFLNTITTDIGAMLIRTADGWVGLPPGPPDTVITSKGPEQVPGWAPQAAGGGGGGFATPSSNTVTTQSGTLSLGNIFTAAIPFGIKTIAVYFNQDTDAEIVFTLATIVGGDVDEILSIAGPFTVEGPETSIVGFDLGGTIQVPAGVPVGLFVTNQQGAGIGTLGNRFHSGLMLGAPLVPGIDRCSISGPVVPGATPNTSGSGAFWQQWGM